MRKLLKTGLACLGIWVGASGVAQATNLITNGSFEQTLPGWDASAPFNTISAPSSSIPGWKVELGSVDWINSYWQAQDGTKSLDLAGFQQQGLVSTTFNTAIGETYRVQFYLAGNPDQGYAKTLVSVGNAIGLDPSSSPPPPPHIFTFVQGSHTLQDMGWTLESFDFVAQTGLTQLLFGDATLSPFGDTNSYGAALDNVSVELLPVPEPSTLLLLGAGLAGLGIFRRKLRPKIG